MAVEQYASVANWFSDTSPRTVTSIDWSEDDVILVCGAIEHGNEGDLSAPTNANLTFSEIEVLDPDDANDSWVGVWAAVAGSDQTGQTVSVSFGDGLNFGFSVRVISGSNGTVSLLGSNFTESAISAEVSAGSAVVSFIADWNANNPPGKTPATGSGTATERTDTGDGATYAVWDADWVGVSAGTFSWGPSDYTSLQVAQIAVEVEAAEAADTAFTADAVWAGWAATADLDVAHGFSASAAWDGWTASATFTAQSTVPFSADGIWGGWAATADLDVTHDFTASAAWSGWTGAATFTSVGSVPFTADGIWEGWTATGLFSVSHDVAADGAWSGWAASADFDVHHDVTADAAWNGWTATAAFETQSDVAFTADAAWGGWTGAAEFAALGDVSFSADAAWDGWTASATFSTLLAPLDEWPNPDNTGVGSGWTPSTTLTETWEISTPGVYTDVLVEGADIEVSADNVTLIRCRVTDGGVINLWTGASPQSGITLIQCEVTKGNGVTTDGGTPAVSHAGYSAYRCKIVDMSEGFRSGGLGDGGDPVLIQDCWVRAKSPDTGTDWHGDCLQGFNAPATTVRNCYFELWEYDQGGTSPLFYPDQGGSDPLTVDGLICAGGGISFRLGVEGSTVDGLRVIENSYESFSHSLDEGTALSCGSTVDWGDTDDNYMVTVDDDYQPTDGDVLACNTAIEPDDPTFAYSGADPSEQADTAEYTLGTQFSLVSPIWMTHVHIWNPGNGALTDRAMYLWDDDTDTLLFTQPIPETLSTGWNTIAVNDAVNGPTILSTGVTYMLGYDVGGIGANDYGATLGAFSGGSDSDGTVSLDAGLFVASNATLPTTGGSTFYGIEPGYIDVEVASGSVSFTADASWGGWTGAATFTTQGETAFVADAAWSGWVAAATFDKTVDVTASATWAGWTATASFDAGSSIAASFDAVWGGWAASATVDVAHAFTASGVWSGWTASATFNVEGTTTFTANALWLGWAGVAGLDVSHHVAASAAWGGWTGSATFTSQGEIPFTASGDWGGWSADADFTAVGLASFVATAIWLGWAASANFQTGEPIALVRLRLLNPTVSIEVL